MTTVETQLQAQGWARVNGNVWQAPDGTRWWKSDPKPDEAKTDTNLLQNETSTALRAHVETMQAALTDDVLDAVTDIWGMRDYDGELKPVYAAMRAVLQKALTLPPKETP